MKSFGQKSWMLPQPVLIIGTYDKNGKPNAMNAAWGGQWDAKEIMISMGAHATTENLNNCPDFTVAFDISRIKPFPKFSSFSFSLLSIVLVCPGCFSL